MQATKLLLTGPSSVSADIRSAQAGTCWAVLWHLKAITPSILSFVSIVVHFVLSGDQSFDMVTPTANYMDIYEKTIELLRLQHQKHHAAYNGLIDYYNMSVLPNIHLPQAADNSDMAGMTDGRRVLYLEMMEEPDEEEEEGDGAEG
ncbi:hypothetical protein FRC08_009757 [Ceratobasidium sp. 394]|nr:hypothetical protein FRC08_009757 [Ceratobasidium sp. 394]